MTTRKQVFYTSYLYFSLCWSLNRQFVGGFGVTSHSTRKFRLASTTQRSVASFWPQENDDTTTSKPSKSTSTAPLDISITLPKSNVLLDAMPIVSASLLVTGNTFGAGCLVMPDLAAQVGSLSAFQGIFAGAYVINLLSGISIMQVAIHQHQQGRLSVSDHHDRDAPCSFQEFAQHSLQSNTAAFLISAISMFVNACVLAFDLSRIGSQGSAYTELPAPLVATVWATLVALGLGTLTNQRLSQMASICCMSLFASFGALILPALLNADTGVPSIDILAVVPETAVADPSQIAQVAPIILMSMVFQNIVPTITKMLNYERPKVIAAMALGTLLPWLMYTSFAALASSTFMNPEESSLLLAIFSLSCLCGSAIGTGMSLVEEMQQHVGSPSSRQSQVYDSKAVIASVILPLMATLAWSDGGDLTSALGVAGSFGSPILYGIVPAWMTLSQQKQQSVSIQDNWTRVALPMGVGALSMGYVGQELLQCL